MFRLGLCNCADTKGSRNFSRLPRRTLASVETLVEALDASAGIDQLLLAREERVALGADFNLDVLFGGEHLDDVAAVAGDRGLLAIRMDAFLCHGFHLFQVMMCKI